MSAHRSTPLTTIEKFYTFPYFLTFLLKRYLYEK